MRTGSGRTGVRSPVGLRDHGAMASTTTDLAPLLARYARRLHALAGTEHHVASPLGAWLLLAVCASAAGPAAADGPHAAEVRAAARELEDALGTSVDEAAAIAARMLAAPHPVVAAGAAVWNDPVVATGGWQAWVEGLSAAIGTGALPDQPALDTWARQHSLGMIPQFPVPVTDETVALLATVLATRVSWDVPFELVPATRLGPTSPWAGRLGQALATPPVPGRGHRPMIVASPLGDVAVHAARADGGLTVVSVAADQDVPAAEVLDLAHTLAPALALDEPVDARSLFDLPLSDGPLWSLTEEEVTSTGWDSRVERITAVLPAWSASDQHDLDAPDLGFAAAARLLSALAGSPAPLPFEAVQAVVASYDREGFEAAAVTAMAVATSALASPRRTTRRTAELRFGHPYAVVAVTTDTPPRGRVDPTWRTPWHGTPTFSAWITTPTDP